MSEHPAEIPSEGEGGSGRVDWSKIRGGIGGPNELPPFDWVSRVSVVQLVSEVFRLRDRVHTLESGMLASRMSQPTAMMARFGGGIIGGPNELPEGEGGGSGGGGVFPHGEINPPELPINRFVAELSVLVGRFTQFERLVTQQLGAITQRLDAMKK